MASLSASVELQIERPIEDIWAYVSDVRNQDAWVDGMSESQLVGDSEQVRRGSQIRAVYSYGGGTAPVAMTVTEFRAPRLIAIETSDGPFPFTGRLELDRRGSSATLVRNSMTAGSDHIFTTLMFRFLPFITRPLMTKQLRKELTQLKTILESTP